jgi:hypothetical protein
MVGNALVVGIIALACTITTVVATFWLATQADVPSETAVPVGVVLLLALRWVVRRKRASTTSHDPTELVTRS